jgi:hypothetical protein
MNRLKKLREDLNAPQQEDKPKKEEKKGKKEKK